MNESPAKFPGGLSPHDREWLTRRFGQDALFDEPLNKYASLGVGGPATALVIVSNPESLAELILWTKDRDLPYFPLGNGTNLLILDHGIPGIVMRLAGDFRALEADKAGTTSPALIRAGAGAPLAALCSFAIKNGLDGLNFATGIPGSVGGAILMNAGTSDGCMADALREIRFMDNLGREISLGAHEIDWGYRKMSHNLPGGPGREAIITGGLFTTRPGDPETLQRTAQEILRRRKAVQPQGVRSAGSFFKNPPGGASAGELIDKAGLKGKAIGGAMVSPIHGNWIVNTGKATASDILSLMDLVRREVFNAHGISLEPEVKIAGT